MAVKTLIFSFDDKFNELRQHYAMSIQRGEIEIVGYANFDENGNVNIFSLEVIGNESSESYATIKTAISSVDFQILLIPFPQNNSNEKLNVIEKLDVSRQRIFATVSAPDTEFYKKLKFLEGLGVPYQNIIDERAFQISNLDFYRLLDEGIAYGIFENSNSFTDTTNTIYPRIYKFRNLDVTIKLGTKSRINYDARLEAFGQNNLISFGNFSQISWNALFELGLNGTHNHRGLFSYAFQNLDWESPKEFLPTEVEGNYKIEIGNDVWIGRDCFIKASRPDKPLLIGDGAVIASKSMVVKNVPPYAIVGGNPAQVIKYRFDEKIIEKLLRIKWWDWDIDKIHDNFKYFNRIEEFVDMHDK